MILPSAIGSITPSVVTGPIEHYISSDSHTCILVIDNVPIAFKKNAS
jgi:hypothetical protein